MDERNAYKSWKCMCVMKKTVLRIPDNVNIYSIYVPSICFMKKVQGQ